MQIWPIRHESKVFLYVIFLFIFCIKDAKSKRLLEYYTSNISTAAVFTAVIIIIALILAWKMSLVSHIFLVGLCSIWSWFLISIIVKYIILKANKKPYRILIHPSDLPKVTYSKKIQLISCESITPHDIKEVHGIIIDSRNTYSEEWTNIILHSKVSGLALIDIKEYEELIEHRLSLSQLQTNWMEVALDKHVNYNIYVTFFNYTITLILSPIIILFSILISITILLTMGRPIMYTQKRIGKNNKIFKIYKFRSMHSNRDSQGETIKNDDRITHFGKAIRKFRLDELPQFFNIIKGEMSLIGPRPEWIKTAQQFEKNIPLYKLRQLVKPGITGWAQVRQGHVIGNDSNTIKLQYDLYYVKHQSLSLDVKIICYTIYTLLSGFGSK